MVLGEVGNFSAYGFAPASLVAPLGTTTVIANMFIAVGILKEKLRPADIFGCSMAVVGAFLLVNFSTRTEKVLDADGIVEHLQKLAFIIYLCTEVAVLTALFVVKLKFHIDSVLVLILITALLASFTVISAKAVSGMLQLTMAGCLQIHYAIFWLLVVIMVVTGIAQVKFLNQAMQLFDSTTVVPTNFVFFTISAILAGIVFYNEFWGMAPFDVFMFLLGCVLCFIGVYFITAGRVAESANASTVEVTSVQGPQSSLGSYRDVIPTWLLSPISQQEVQPRRSDVAHNILASTEQQPFISWDEDSGTIQEVSTPDTLQGQQSPHSDTKSPSNDVTAGYGALDSH
ncbi:hypothetical protein NP493_2g19025 [Ridgeia piscesae]|uniref:NIPA-like protein 2 n=1 Tax=Ridgeia piscesae TaxID=27915 RepID=A0AAD9ULZ5_RIDPI|nr:hypothetical protein NP493_2g19025 [Ridgeia piscesae]